MNNLELRQAKKWAHKESTALLAAGWPKGSPLETSLLDHWRMHRLRMMVGLGQSAAEKLAHVLTHRMLEAERENLRSGMNPFDAREEAEKDWLLMEPELEDEPLPDVLFYEIDGLVVAKCLKEGRALAFVFNGPGWRPASDLVCADGYRLNAQDLAGEHRWAGDRLYDLQQLIDEAPNYDHATDDADYDV